MNWVKFNLYMSPGALRAAIFRLCLLILVANSFCCTSFAETTTREQQWSDELKTFLRDSICSRNLIPKWPDPEWLEHPLFTADDARTFFSSDTITVYIEYDYIFSWVSITLYNGMYEKWISISPTEHSNQKVAVSARYDYDITKPDFSDILQADVIDLSYYYVINWDFNIPEFILVRVNGRLLDYYTRYLAYRIIRHPDDTFSVQNGPADLSSILCRDQYPN